VFRPIGCKPVGLGLISTESCEMTLCRSNYSSLAVLSSGDHVKTNFENRCEMILCMGLTIMNEIIIIIN